VVDKETVARIQANIGVTIRLIEEVTGELSQGQRNNIGSMIFGFWVTQEDKRHPRADGQLWKDIVKERAE